MCTTFQIFSVYRLPSFSKLSTYLFPGYANLFSIQAIEEDFLRSIYPASLNESLNLELIWPGFLKFRCKSVFSCLLSRPSPPFCLWSRALWDLCCWQIRVRGGEGGGGAFWPTENFEINFLSLRIPSCPLLRKFRRMLFYSSLEISRRSNHNFQRNYGRCPPSDRH